MDLAEQQKQEKQVQSMKLPSPSMKPTKLHRTSLEQLLKHVKQCNRRLVMRNEILCKDGDTSFTWMNKLRKVVGKQVQIKQIKGFYGLKLSNYRVLPGQCITPPHSICETPASVIAEHFSKLKSLDLNLHNWYEKDNLNIEILARDIGRNLFQLQKLRLNLNMWYCMTNGSLETLMREICRNLVNLTDLDLNLDRTQLYDPALQALACEIGRYQTNLKSLKLSFLSQRNFTSQGIEDFASRISSRLRKLQTLSLHFSGYQISSESLRSIMSTICTNLRTLQHLEFTFDCSNNSRSFWIILSRVTQYLRQLEYLSFNLSSSEAIGVESGDTDICQQLSSLKVLELKLSKVIPCEKSLEILKAQITHYFNKLEQLIMTLYYDDVSPASAGNSLPILLYNMNESLQNLRSMSISVIGSQISTENWPKCTGKNLSSLKHLTLLFSLSKGITTECLQALGERLFCSLPNLESLVLDFRWCRVTQEGLEKFAYIIKDIPLNNLKLLTCYSNYNIRDKVKTMFSFVPSLQIR